MGLQVPTHAEGFTTVLAAVLSDGCVASHAATSAATSTSRSGTVASAVATASGAGIQLGLAILEVLHLLDQLRRAGFRVGTTVNVRNTEQVAGAAWKTSQGSRRPWIHERSDRQLVICAGRSYPVVVVVIVIVVDHVVVYQSDVGGSHRVRRTWSDVCVKNRIELDLKACFEGRTRLTRQVRWRGQEALSRPQVVRAQVARNEGWILGGRVVEPWPTFSMGRHHQVVR